MYQSIKTPLKPEYGITLLLSCFILAVTLVNQSWNEFMLVTDQTIQSIPSARTQLASALDGADSGLVGWWKFDEGSGTTAGDASGNGNIGTLINGPTWTTDSKVGSGAIGFDGVDDYVDIPTAVASNLNKQITYSLWVKPSSVSLNRMLIILGGDSTTDAGAYLRIQNGNAIYFVLGDGTNRDIASMTIPALSTDNWYYLTAVADLQNGTKKIYINGALSNSKPISLTGSLSATASVHKIGFWSGDHYSGLIDDVRVYNRALSAAEISELYTTTDLSTLG